MINDLAKIAKVYLFFILLVLALKAFVLPRIANVPEQKKAEESECQVEVAEENRSSSNIVTHVRVREKPHQKNEVTKEVCDVDYERVFAEKLAKNIEKIQQQAEQGDVEAQWFLSVSFLKGYNNEKSWEKALEWLQKSAQGGFARAQCELGMRYLRGDELQGNELPKDFKQARFWLEKAMDANDPEIKKAAENEINYLNLIEIIGGEKRRKVLNQYFEERESSKP